MRSFCALLPLLLSLSACERALAGELDDLRRELRKGSSAERRAAVAKLAELGPDAEPAIGDLVRAVKKDDDPTVVLEACGALGKIGPPAIKSLVRLMRSKKGNPVAAARALGSMGPAAAPALGALVGVAKKKEQVGLAAISALGKLGPVGLEPLERLLKSERDPQRRVAVLYALGALAKSGVETLPLLYSHLVANPKLNLEANRAAARALVSVGAEAVPELQKALAHEEPLVVGLAVEALAEIGEPARAAVPALAKLLSELTPEAKPAQEGEAGSSGGRLPELILMALGELGGAEALAILRSHAAGELAPQRAAACKALARAGEGGMTALLELLRSGDAARTASAAAALAGAGEAALKPTLGRLLATEEDDEAATLGVVLGRLGDVARDDLLHLIEEGTSRQRVAAALGLAQSRGEAAESAVKPVMKLARSSIAAERQAAVAALGVLGSVSFNSEINELLDRIYKEDPSYLVREEAQKARLKIFEATTRRLGR